jgi:predicted Fe-Mo cluster-binding NifX family protein
MKIAISTEGGAVSAHFGRCPSYTLVDIEDGKAVERREIPNPGHSPGFLPGYLAEMGVATIIAGGMGPRAQDLFAQNKIQTIIGIEGRVDDVVDRFLQGTLEPGPDLCDHRGAGQEGPCREEAGGGPPAPSPAPVNGLLCVSAKGRDLDAELDPRFGRAPYFLFVDLGSGAFEAVENSMMNAAHGAGIQAAQLVLGKKPSAVLTGQVGPNAARVLEAGGIRVVTTNLRTVREAVEALKRG